MPNLKSKPEYRKCFITLADNISQVRIEKEITQRDLAKMIGVATGTIGSYESYRTIPNIVTLTRIALALGVDVQDLIPIDEIKNMDTVPVLKNQGSLFA